MKVLSLRKGWPVLHLAVPSALALVALFWLVLHADPSVFSEIWGSFEPNYMALALLLFGVTLLIRGVRLAFISEIPSGEAEPASWMRLSAQHQMMFSVLPSGLGDAAFPFLAQKQVGLEVWKAIRVLAIYRVQDFCALLLLGGLGVLSSVALSSASYTQLVIGLALCGVLLVWSADFMRWGARLILKVARIATSRSSRLNRRLERLTQELPESISFRVMLLGAALTILTWSMTLGAVWFTFAAIGTYLSPTQAILIVVGLNVVGALAAFTIAGLGVSEGGLAAILLTLGFPGEEAVAIALIVRPAILLMTLISCLFCDLLAWGLTKRSPNR